MISQTTLRSKINNGSQTILHGSIWTNCAIFGQNLRFKFRIITCLIQESWCDQNGGLKKALMDNLAGWRVVVHKFWKQQSTFEMWTIPIHFNTLRVSSFKKTLMDTQKPCIYYNTLKLREPLIWQFLLVHPKPPN